MAFVDWGILIIYLGALILMSIVIGRKQKDQRDYYLAGQRLKSWQVGASFVANQVSAISLIGVPAFIAVRPGGGLKWLQYELAVPLAMIVIIVFLIPVYWQNRGYSIYEYLERRFDAVTRRILSLVFLISRSLAAGVILLTTSYVASICIRLPLWMTIVIIGFIALVYTSLGGIRADIYSDILQLITLWAGSLILIGVILNTLKGVPVTADLDPARLDIFRFGHGPENQRDLFGFWPMLLGGFFLYISYYGCDQSQAQRLLTTPGPEGAKKALLYNTFLRFPLVLTYSAVGILLISFLKRYPEFHRQVSRLDPNFLMPEFLRRFVPAGLLGIIVAGVFAATMSSLDSTINSLSAATWEDGIRPLMPRWVAGLTRRRKILVSRLITLGWGMLVIGFAVHFSHSSETVVELVNKIGSAFYGPVAAVFLLGVSLRRLRSLPLLIGLAAGVMTNLSLWVFCSRSISWMWWNAIGFGMVTGVTILLQALRGDRIGTVDLQKSAFGDNRLRLVSLLLFFFFIFLFLILMERVFS